MLLLAATHAFAASYYFLDSGTRAIGRGGAFVAGADDLSAQYYNPAALIHLDRPQVNLNGWMVNQYVRFDRADEPGLEDGEGNDIGTFEAVENEAPNMMEPSAGFASPLGGLHPALKNTVLAVGLYVPTSPYMAYPEDGPQRYGLIDSLVWQVYAGPSVAQRITPWLTVGAGLQYTFLRVEQQLAAAICLTEDKCEEGNDDPLNDIALDLKTWDPVKMSWNAGVLVQPTEWLEIGASVQPPIHYEAPGSLTATFNEESFLAQQLDGTTFTDDDILLLVTVPLIVRGGVQVQPVDNVRVEAAGTWTQWSALTELRVTDMDMVVRHDPESMLVQEDIPVTDDIVFATGYRDAWSARLGGDWDVTEWARVSAGAHWESSAVPPETQGVSVVDGNKWGLGLGGTFTIADRVAIDVSAAQQYLADRDIADSQLRQQELYVNPAEPDESEVVQGKVVGNGQFTSRLTFVAVGATLYFGGSDAR